MLNLTTVNANKVVVTVGSTLKTLPPVCYACNNTIIQSTTTKGLNIYNAATVQSIGWDKQVQPFFNLPCLFSVVARACPRKRGTDMSFHY